MTINKNNFISKIVFEWNILNRKYNFVGYLKYFNVK